LLWLFLWFLRFLRAVNWPVDGVTRRWGGRATSWPRRPQTSEYFGQTEPKDAAAADDAPNVDNNNNNNSYTNNNYDNNQNENENQNQNDNDDDGQRVAYTVYSTRVRFVLCDVDFFTTSIKLNP